MVGDVEMTKYKCLITVLALTGSILLSSCSNGSSSNTSTTSTTVVQYNPFTYPNAVAGSGTAITGVRGVTNSTSVYVSGIYMESSGNVGLFYQGSVTNSESGTWYTLNYPSSRGVTVTGTSVYGPNNGTNSNNIQAVGEYTTVETGTRGLGFLYQGPFDGSGTWTTLHPVPLDGSPVIFTFAHSTMGGLVVGNFDTHLSNGHAFIYDINIESYTELKVGRVSTTAYGIWWNGGASYTIAGGYSNVNESGIDIGYVLDWNSTTQTASNITSYYYNNRSPSNKITHFEGIDGSDGAPLYYTLASDWTESANGTSTSGATLVYVYRNINGSFDQSASWTDISYPNAKTTSANTVYQNNILGVYTVNGSGLLNGFVASVYTVGSLTLKY